MVWAERSFARSGEVSRVGKYPLPIPDGTTVALDGGQVRVEGKNGKLATPLLEGMSFKLEDGSAIIERADDSRGNRARHGLMRRLVANMIEGATTGFTRRLEIHGVGYRASVSGNKVNLSLGFSHPIEFELPDGVTAKMDGQTTIALASADKRAVGEIAARIRRLRPPEPYKGKGIRYEGEEVRRKAGKAAATAAG